MVRSGVEQKLGANRKGQVLSTSLTQLRKWLHYCSRGIRYVIKESSWVTHCSLRRSWRQGSWKWQMKSPQGSLLPIPKQSCIYKGELHLSGQSGMRYNLLTWLFKADARSIQYTSVQAILCAEFLTVVFKTTHPPWFHSESSQPFSMVLKISVPHCYSSWWL